MTGEIEKKGWEDLTKDEMDLFISPHTKMASSEFTTSGFSLRDKALAIINELDDAGKKEALLQLNQATSHLTHEHDVNRKNQPNLSPIPHNDIRAIRDKLMSDIGLR